jgi:hypothetical protein
VFLHLIVGKGGGRNKRRGSVLPYKLKHAKELEVIFIIYCVFFFLVWLSLSLLRYVSAYSLQRIVVVCGQSVDS